MLVERRGRVAGLGIVKGFLSSFRPQVARLGIALLSLVALSVTFAQANDAAAIFTDFQNQGVALVANWQTTAIAIVGAAVVAGLIVSFVKRLNSAK